MSQTEHTQHFETSPPESKLNELVLELDAADTGVCMIYSQYLDKPRPEKLEAIEASQTLLLESYGDTGEALDCLIELFRLDLAVLQQYTNDYYNSPKALLKERLTRTSLGIAKIGAGTVMALFVYDKIKRA